MVQDNTITISGGIIKTTGISAGGMNLGTASGNHFYLYGGTITGASGTGNAVDVRVVENYANSVVHDNIMTIDNTTGTLNIADANLYGYYTANSPTTPVAHSGNTLNLYGTNIMEKGPIKAHSLQNFDNLNFTLPANADQNTVMLNLSDTADVSNNQVGVALSGPLDLNPGETLALVRAAGGVSGIAANKGEKLTLQGGLYLYTLEVDQDPNNLLLRMPSAPTTARGTETLPQAGGGSLSLLGMGGDLVVDLGLPAAAQAAGYGHCFRSR